MHGNELVRYTENHIRDRIAAVKQEHATILLSISLQQEQNADQSGESLAKTLKQKLCTKYVSLARIYDEKLVPKASLGNRFLYNPQVEINEQSLQWLGDDESATCSIVRGFKPKGYTDTTVPTLDNYKSDFWATRNPSVYSNILLNLDSTLEKRVYNDFSTSVIMHVTPVNSSISDALTGSEHLFTDPRTGIKGLWFVHNGWVYDGHRHDAVLYAEPKKFAPVDCSQFVGDMLEMKNLFRTEDMLFSYRHKRNSGYIRKNWLAEPRANELNNHFKIISNEAVEPGDIHVCFDFKKSKKHINTRTHVHGHTTIVHSKQGSTVLTFSAGQTHENRDGIGYEEFSMAPMETLDDGEVRQTIFLRPV